MKYFRIGKSKKKLTENDPILCGRINEEHFFLILYRSILKNTFMNVR